MSVSDDQAHRAYVSSLEQSQRRLAMKIRRAHATLDLRDLDATWPDYVSAIGAAGVITEADISAYEAMLYFLTILEAAEQTAPKVPTLTRFQQEHLTSLLYLTGPIFIKRLIKHGWQPQAAMLSSLRRSILWLQGEVNGHAQQQIYDAGIEADAIAMAQRGERVLQGYERIAEPGACPFCRRLAGATQVHADGYTQYAVFNVTPKWMKPHPHCQCTLRPLPIYRTTHVRTAAEIALGQQMYEQIKAARDRAKARALSTADAA